jgi:hypothetical protein
MKGMLRMICENRRALLRTYGVSDEQQRGLESVGSGAHAHVFVCESWRTDVVFKFGRLPGLPETDPLGLKNVPFVARDRGVLETGLVDSMQRNESEVSALDALETSARKINEAMARLGIDSEFDDDISIAPKLVIPPNTSRDVAMAAMNEAIAVVMGRVYPLVVRDSGGVRRASLSVLQIVNHLTDGTFSMPHFDMHVGQFMCKKKDDPSSLVLVDWGGSSLLPTSPHFNLSPSMIHPQQSFRIPDVVWSAGCIVLCLLCKGDNKYAFVNPAVEPAPRPEVLAVAWAKVVGHPSPDLVTATIKCAIVASGAPAEPAKDAREFAERVIALHGGPESMYAYDRSRSVWDDVYKLVGRWQRIHHLSDLFDVSE